MPILLAVNNYHYRRDGSEAVFFDHAYLFRQAGWEVVPFSMQHPSNLPSPWADFFVSEVEFGRVYSLPQKLVRIPKVIYSLEARRNLGRLLDRVRPDICHCHSIYHHLSPSILGLLKRRGIPVVMTLHDLKLACPAYHMFNRGAVCERCKGGRLHELLLGRCIKGSLALSTIVAAEAVLHGLLHSYRDHVDRFIVPCRHYLEKLVEWGWDRERFVHIPNFVDPLGYLPDPRPGSAFLYFGRLSPEKGLTTLIEAAAKAGVCVQLAGDGPQRDALQALAETLHADVQFLGRLEGDALHAAVRSSRATVLPAVWYENAPISVLESYALAKPVIGADIGGLSELILQDHTGALVPSGCSDTLAATLRRFAELPDARIAEMGRAGRALVETRYSPASYFNAVEGLYDDLVRTG